MQEQFDNDPRNDFENGGQQEAENGGGQFDYQNQTHANGDEADNNDPNQSSS